MLRLDHNKDSQQRFRPPFAAGRGRQGNLHPMRQPDDKKQTSSASDTPPAASPREVLSHQEKVYFEMFRAIEQLGRKLEKAEAERYMLSRRLADIEQSAERDEETGRLYLPAKIEQPALPPLSEPMPRVMQAAIAASFVIALCALGAVIMQDMPQKLSPQQLAALETLSARAPQTAEWRKPAEAAEKPVLADAAPEVDIEAADVEMAAVAAEASAPAAADKAEPAVAAVHDDEEAAEDFSAHLEDALSDLPAQTQTAAAENAAEETRPASPAPDMAAAQASAENKDVTVMTEGAEPSFAEVRAEDNTVEVLSEQAQTAPAALAAVTPAAGHAAASVQASAPVQVAPVAAETKPQITAAPKQQETLPLMRDSRLPPPLQALEARAFEGYAEAQHDLAAAYADGRLAKQDYARARAWFARAAGGGVANAHYNLGVMAQQGLGVPVNMQQAMAHYEDAAKLGHAEAMYNLGLLYAEGRAVPKSAWRAVTYFKRAANAGLVQAAYNLGVIYEGDALGKPDLTAAIEWYDVAAGEGNRDAALAVRRLKRQQAASR